MKKSELQFSYPENLVAISPSRPSRVMWVQSPDQFSEITMAELLERIPAGDVLVINDTKVLPRRIFAQDEILFLNPIKNENSISTWEVLFPSKRWKIGESQELIVGGKPTGVSMTLKQKGRPQIVELTPEVNEEFFYKWGELPLPPYIQKAREQSGKENNASDTISGSGSDMAAVASSRHTVSEDQSWYQTCWAEKAGSLAAPTASLHFSVSDLQKLKDKGVQVLKITLHVGLGTFLPVTTDDLNDHPMHSEWVEIPASVWQALLNAKNNGHHVWAMGTTVARSLESAALGKIKSRAHLLQNSMLNNSPASSDNLNDDLDVESLIGETNLLIQPGYQWQVVDRLLTNFHQPESTLLALVAAFSDLKTVKSVYQCAIEKHFRLFSYGDLSVWIKK